MKNTPPNWSNTPNDIRIRDDIPNATYTDAGKTIVRNKRFLSAASGMTVGGLAGAGAGTGTGIALNEFTNLSDPVSVAIGVTIMLGGTIIGGLGGALFGHKRAKIELAEAELGIRKPAQIHNNQNSLGALTSGYLLNEIVT
jgi:hypothetical protein